MRGRTSQSVDRVASWLHQRPLSVCESPAQPVSTRGCAIAPAKLLLLGLGVLPVLLGPAQQMRVASSPEQLLKEFSLKPCGSYGPCVSAKAPRDTTFH